MVICLNVWIFSACHAGNQEKDSFKYVFLAGEKHEILEENICSTPYSVYENKELCRILKDDLEYAGYMVENFDCFFEAEYFLYDFNEDGQEDYLVSLVGAGYNSYSASGVGNRVYIFLAGEVLKEVFNESVQFAYSGIDGGYASVMVLNEKTDGLYDIVFYGYDAIWRYNAGEERYCRE